MKRRLVVLIPLALLLAAPPGRARQGEPPRAGRGFADSVKRSLARLGASVDEGRGSADMVVSHYPDGRDRITIVVMNDRRKNLIGLYIYNFGSLKEVADREPVYRYLLAANDAITIGSFFVDGEQDIGYKYLISSLQPFNAAAFEAAYLAMATVARDRRGEIRQLLGAPKTGAENRQ